MYMETGLPSFIAGVNFIRRAARIAAVVRPKGNTWETRRFVTSPSDENTQRKMTVPKTPALRAVSVYDGSGLLKTRAFCEVSRPDRGAADPERVGAVVGCESCACSAISAACSRQVSASRSSGLS